MYEHTITAFGPYERHHFRNASVGQSMSLVPAHGACLLSLHLAGHEMIDGYTTPAELAADRWSKSRVLFPFPNRLAGGAYQWRGQSYRFPLNDTHRNNALHGLPSELPFRLTHTDLSAEQMTTVLLHHNTGDDPAYPFRFTVECQFSLHRAGAFGLQIALTNEHDHAIPVGIGYHPYFRVAPTVDKALLHLPPAQMIGVDSNMIPTGKRYDYDRYYRPTAIGADVLDNCFALTDTDGKPAVITLQHAEGSLRYQQQTGPDKFNYVQLFTPPQRQSLAIEPMSCNINAFNSGEGLVSLEPQQQWSAQIELSFTPATVG